MKIKLEVREQKSVFWTFFSPLLAVLCSLSAGVFLFYLLGYPATESFIAFFLKPFSTLYNLGEITIKAIPLILIALGLSVGFRAGVWNIGGEGQFILGALGAASVSLYFIDKEGVWLLPIICISGIIAGALWAALPAFFRTKFNVNEILSSLMLNYIAFFLLVYLVHGVLKDPDGFNFPESKIFSSAALLPVLLSGTRLHAGVFLVLLSTLVVWIIIKKTLLGFQLQVIGLSPKAGAYAGISQKKIIWISMLLSGAFAGLAGMLEVNGAIQQITATFNIGYGYTAIIVAFLGRLHPVGIFLAGILLATSYIGGEIAQLELGFPKAVIGIFQGMLLFFLLACDFFYTHKLTMTKV